ncbi:struthiocalcin-2-like [Pezoporus wallicus]|uniref:struthiocalcin-2-like n=1 Tax=Pezoporus wallicus TaxID=35540 RepID=UPI00254ADC78|nr:struthiocalcin-2-like [Pezoporus wallicus]XP_061324524.1 struthiocalcin-2-like [Pezoporus flaviventris]
MAPTRTLGLLSCLLLLPRLHGQDAAACAWGWVSFQDGCYRVFCEELSWTRAEAFCRRFGAEAHLASVHSSGEHRAIAAMLRSGPCDSDEDDEESSSAGLWIGLHRPEGSHRWHWSDSSELDYGSWHQAPTAEKRTCAALRGTGDLKPWFSDSCTKRKPFVCKCSA